MLAAPLGLVGFYCGTSWKTRRRSSSWRHGKPQVSTIQQLLSDNWPQILNLIGIVILLNVAGLHRAHLHADLLTQC